MARESFQRRNGALCSYRKKLVEFRTEVLSVRPLVYWGEIEVVDRVTVESGRDWVDVVTVATITTVEGGCCMMTVEVDWGIGIGFGVGLADVRKLKSGNSSERVMVFERIELDTRRILTIGLQVSLC